MRQMVSPLILLGAPETGNNVKLEVVGSGQVYPLVEVTLLQMHLTARSAVSHCVGHRAHTRYVKPAGSLDERGKQTYSLIARFAHAVQHGCFRAVKGRIAADQLQALRGCRRFEEAGSCVDFLFGG